MKSRIQIPDQQQPQVGFGAIGQLIGSLYGPAGSAVGGAVGSAGENKPSQAKLVDTNNQPQVDPQTGLEQPPGMMAKADLTPITRRLDQKQQEPKNVLTQGLLALADHPDQSFREQHAPTLIRAHTMLEHDYDPGSEYG